MPNRNACGRGKWYPGLNTLVYLRNSPADCLISVRSKFRDEISSEINARKIPLNKIYRRDFSRIVVFSKWRHYVVFHFYMIWPFYTWYLWHYKYICDTWKIIGFYAVTTHLHTPCRMCNIFWKKLHCRYSHLIWHRLIFLGF